ncbi:MAG: hypothetical protein QNL12_00650, partial [Acidimicrobiia bacterium]|nr:hypothetical protein [Acidimicrobiia bacterium]MDX2465795.1 hypothetical protein [Acidimicrobiia bacterium]
MGLAILRRLRMLLVAGALLVALVVVQLTAVPPVAANNWYGSTGNTGCGGNMQDSTTMTYYRESLGTSWYNAVAYAINNAVIPTDVLMAAESTSHGSTVDVVLQDANYTGTWCGYTWHSGGSLIGYTNCQSLTGSDCNHFHIYSDTSWMTSQTTTRLRNHACHELGHSLGLIHPTSSQER